MVLQSTMTTTKTTTTTTTSTTRTFQVLRQRRCAQQRRHYARYVTLSLLLLCTMWHHVHCTHALDYANANANGVGVVALGASAGGGASGADSAEERDGSGRPNVVVGGTAHEPRFGARLLPLRKKSVNVNVNANANEQNNVLVSANNNNNYNYNIHKSAQTPMQMQYATAAKVKISAKMNASEQQQPQQPQQPHAKPENRALQLGGDDENFVSDTTLPQPPRQREAKLLHRREDIDELTMLEVANVSTADRLMLEMSTEFFVVPTTSTSSSVAYATATSSSASDGGAATARVAPKHVADETLLDSSAGPRSVLIVAPKHVASQHSNANGSSSSSSGSGSGNAANTPPTVVVTHAPAFSGLRKEPWVVPVLVLASLTMLMMAAFEVFVLFKAWRTSPSRRHLFLGQMLLLGLFACAGLGAIITAQPSLLSCGTIRFGVGVAYALVFAALLVKCVFLISLNGGVYLPAPYQGLLLLFAVLIQVAIGAQWLLTQPPEIYTVNVPIVGSGLLASTVASSTIDVGAASSLTSSPSTNFGAIFHSSAALGSDLYTRVSAAGTVLIPLCKTQFSELLFSLIYIVFLIVFVAVLAIKSRGIRDNYREATYIGLAIGGAIPIWLGWMFCGLAVAERHKDACIAFGLVATSATVFLVMFMPKGRQLAAMGKEGLYVEDREEQFSSLSRAGSGYSPSFFHFKPIKYGVMSGGMQNSTTTTNGANMKHCSNGMSGGGDRVALVSAAPPSYTRMYHYFPAHLTTAHPFCFYPQPPPPPPPPLPQISSQSQPPPPPLTQLPSPPTLKQLGNSLTSMTQAHIAQTLRYPGLFIRPDETNLYTTLEPTLSSNPNVYFQRGGAVHPGMMY